MNGVPFHATVMGRWFYEANVPKLIEELARLNKNLEALVERAGDRGLESATTKNPVDDESHTVD